MTFSELKFAIGLYHTNSVISDAVSHGTRQNGFQNCCKVHLTVRKILSEAYESIQRVFSSNSVFLVIR